MAGRCGSWSPSATRGRARSGSPGSSSRPRTSAGSGRCGATTSTLSRSPRSDTATRRDPAPSSNHRSTGDPRTGQDARMRVRRILAAFATLFVVAGLIAGPVSPAAASSKTVKIAAAGDLVCSGPPNKGADPTSHDRRYIRGFCQYGKVANLVAKGGYDRFLTLGDLQYYFGRYRDFQRWYDPTYGRVMRITMPSPGNHESYTVDAKGNPYAGYRKYFGSRAHWKNRSAGRTPTNSAPGTTCRSNPSGGGGTRRWLKAGGGAPC